MSQLRAGWYLDPQPDHPGMLRWWDGEAWSEHTTAAAGVGSGESERMRLITRYWSEQPQAQLRASAGAAPSTLTGPAARVGGSWNPPQSQPIAATWTLPAGANPATWEPQAGTEVQVARPEVDPSAVASLEGAPRQLPAEQAAPLLGTFVLGEQGKSRRDTRQLRRGLVAGGLVVALVGGGGFALTRERAAGQAISSNTAGVAAEAVLLSDTDLPGAKSSGAVQTVRKQEKIDRSVDRSVRACTGVGGETTTWAASTGSLQRGPVTITTRAVVHSPASAAAAQARITSAKWGGCFVSAQSEQLTKQGLVVQSAGALPGVDKQAPVLRAVRFQLRLPSGKPTYQDTIFMVVGQVELELTTTSPAPLSAGDQQRLARILADRAQLAQQR